MAFTIAKSMCSFSVHFFPYIAGDGVFAAQCHDAFVKGQVALDLYLWNETAEYYNAYTTEYCGQQGGGQAKRRKWFKEEVGLDPNTPGAFMSDSFYAQVGQTEGQ